MSSFLTQPRRRLAAGALVLAAAVAAGPLSAGGSAAHAAGPRPAAPTGNRASSAPAGFTAAPITVPTEENLRQWGLASDGAGTSYLGYLDHNKGAGSDTVHLVTLGGGHVTGTFSNGLSLPVSGNSRLEVVTSGVGRATLVWLADTATGTVVETDTFSSGALGGAVQSDMVAPTSSRLLAATLGPDQKIWTVVGGGADATSVTVHDGDQPVGTVLTTPYSAIDARLDFDAAGHGVLAVVPTSQVTKPVAYAVTPGAGGSWSSFSTVAHTWNQGDAFGLVGNGSGVHLVASTDASSYYPVTGALTGNTFGAVHLTGDTNSCAPQSHDLSTDASGRVADVSEACNKLRLANLPDASHEGYVDLPSGGVLAAGQPQLVTTSIGTGWVAWAIENGNLDRLEVAPVLLPAALTSQTQRSDGGSVTVTGPRSCLPPVDVRVGAKAKAGKGWHADNPTLKLGSQTLSGGVLHGSTLTAGTKYTLTASGDFSRKVRRHHHEHTEHSHESASLTFTTCTNGAA